MHHSGSHWGLDPVSSDDSSPSTESETQTHFFALFKPLLRLFIRANIRKPNRNLSRASNIKIASHPLLNSYYNQYKLIINKSHKRHILFSLFQRVQSAFLLLSELSTARIFKPSKKLTKSVPKATIKSSSPPPKKKKYFKAILSIFSFQMRSHVFTWCLIT